MTQTSKIRNLAIIAHIDHGKTTLLDSLLKQSSLFAAHETPPERMMDSYDQEKERGITIFAKHTSIPYGEFKINLIDTPGHSDFSAEVERILGMVDSVLLLVDAREGPMPQTRFVLSKALKMGLSPIVVINKIDRPNVSPDDVLDKTFDLFVELGANDRQLDFPHCYASGLSGFAQREINDPKIDMKPLFELIIEKAPPPKGSSDRPFVMQAATISYSDFLGRQATGQILDGKIRKGERLLLISPNSRRTEGVVKSVEGYWGLNKIEMEEACAGDIVKISGFPEVMIGDTLCTPGNPVQLPPIAIDEPTVSIDISVNTSPLMPRDGDKITFQQIKERLWKEQRSNVSLKIRESSKSQDAITVSGRGELHLAVLIEAMRREGFELTISKPEVILKEIDGVLQEPIEKLYIEVPNQYSGAVIEELSRSKAEMQHLEITEHDIAKIEFLIPTRGLMGYRNRFLTTTRGLGILTAIFDSFAPWKGEIIKRKEGVLISMNQGSATAYSCFSIQDRGSLFVTAGDVVYEGMIVGEHNRDQDLIVNVIKGKQLTNIRAAGSDEALTLTPPRRLTLEEAIDFIDDDELVEVTPKNIRLRKKFLKENDRKRQRR